MKPLDKVLLHRAIDCLCLQGILKTEKGKNGRPLPLLDSEFETICNHFIFDSYNIGLEQAIIFCEQAPKGDGLEQKRFQFCQALLQWLDPASRHSNLLAHIHNHPLPLQDKLHHDIHQALNYFKCSMQIGKRPKSQKKDL